MSGSLDFSDPEIAARLNSVIRKMVQSEIDKSRPAPRYAVVNSINLEQKYCMVTYNGEDVSVRVPFNSVIPNEVGQEVRIEGTAADRYIAAIRGTSKIESQLIETTETANTALTDADNANGLVGSVSSEMNSQFDAYKYNRPIAEGPDPTGTCNIDYGHCDNTDVNVTSSMSRWGMMRCGLNTAAKSTISFGAYRTQTVTDFYFDIYSINENTGEFTVLYSSPNYAQALGTQMAFVYLGFPVINSQPGTCFGIQFRVSGAGTVTMMGKTFRSNVPLPGFYPLKPGGQRIPGSNPVPTTISASDAQAFLYGDITPFVQLGSEVKVNRGRHFFDLFNRSEMGPNWNLFHWAGNTSSNLSINSNRVIYTGNNDGYQAALWSYPMATDDISVEQTFIENGNNRQNILFLNSAFNLSGLKVSLIRYDGKVGIFTPNGTATSSPRVEIPWKAGEYERWRIWYDSATKTYNTLCDGEERGLSWVDVNNEVPHGLGRRSVGFGISRSLFYSGSPVDNFAADDWKD